jgi:hypothetical protein
MNQVFESTMILIAPTTYVNLRSCPGNDGFAFHPHQLFSVSLHFYDLTSHEGELGYFSI